MLTNFFLNNKSFKEIKNDEIKESVSKKNSAIWTHISNINPEELEILKDVFQIHPTTVEDIFSGQTRTKYEEFEEYTFIIFKGIKTIKKDSIETYNISIIIGENFILTSSSPSCETVEELCKNKKRIENLLKKGKDYIAHFILDKEIDKYLKIKTLCGEELKEIEREFMENQSGDILKKIFSKELNFLELRQLSESATDLCLIITKPADNYIDNNLIPYFRDIYDHAFKTTEGYKSMLGRMNGIKNMYATITSMKTNEVMRSLTIIMALMMPLTLITGFWGMNVKLPFQNSFYAPIYLTLIMIFLSGLMIWISKKRGWILNKD
ncbi:MAG: magnesium transporter CorA family protein [Candidatus Paceibacterota bacterium]|jgi:magnesium transporter